jgi:hypothetical protein
MRASANHCRVKHPGEKWGDRRDSNPQQPESQSGALPLSYGHHLKKPAPKTSRELGLANYFYHWPFGQAPPSARHPVICAPSVPRTMNMLRTVPHESTQHRPLRHLRFAVRVFRETRGAVLFRPLPTGRSGALVCRGLPNQRTTAARPFRRLRRLGRRRPAANPGIGRRRASNFGVGAAFVLVDALRAALVRIDEPGVVDPEQVEDRGVQVVDMEPVFDRIEAEFVGGPDGATTR